MTTNTEVRSQMSDVRSQKSDLRFPISDHLNNGFN